MTPFEKRIGLRIREFGRIVLSIDLYEICSNVYKSCGENPSDIEIDFEVEAYYFEQEDQLERLKNIPGIEFGTL